ncbi:hypothetical protein ACJMK2_023082 [Sinanodonta woodiana]|uniref:G-protein coupled receptors family 1 profile domain-containing protein n=1 Tax=Sinanodonta woodiana TaxID=1069815 RepID=A0ABD3T325_SINWO
MSVADISTPDPQNHSSNWSTTNSILQEEVGLDAILVPVVWGFLTFVGSFGNALVIYTLIRYGDKNATNYFVINLAISDFAFIVIVVPFTATMYAIPDWIFGNGMCKITMYMIYVTLHATCLTLTAMTIDRYCAIVYAVRSMNWRTPRASLIICFVVWLVSFLFSLPFAIFFRTVDDLDPQRHIYCTEKWPEPIEVWNKGSIIGVVTTTYVVPLSVIIFCYTRILKTLWQTRGQVQSNGISSIKAQAHERRRKRVTKMVASVVLVFAAFWLPIHIINLWMKLDKGFPRSDQMFAFKIFAHTLSYANSCVNPIVYAFLSDGFRKSFRKSFPNLVRRFGLCRGVVEEPASMAPMVEKCTEETRMIVQNRAKRFMQTDL